ncbi:hypothetical protein BDV37DRAFT_243410 [Aspergillus pseudonomiae]|uniref:MYND-type domain-containing protein n=1 Tax=Aspergillus pseudonomiae TaxID=1506151 RepID=A0A5N7DIE9_9EURO|nr:uncharacterized protein BDV37DRAFT_243410 [Aspergillus pseudonomiae]KAE8406207.1 hypothetical protein BDV37DRAFT_243410 [Aspergillus pseudonomiae]
MENSSSTTGNCAHCQSPATKRCSGCSGAPEYDDEIPGPTLYCSSACQTQDWVEHRAKCKQLQARKSLSRAANLLQAILYRIRLRAHGVTSATAHVDGSRVILCPAKEEQEEVYRPLGPLCVDLEGGDQRAFDAIVMVSSCTEAVVYLFVFVRDILSGRITPLVLLDYPRALLTAQAFAPKSRNSQLTFVARKSPSRGPTVFP